MRLSPLLPPITRYVYDCRGNVIEIWMGTDDTGATDSDPDGAGPLESPETTYIYGVGGRLTSVTDPLTHVTSYGYDALGRLTSTTDAEDGESTIDYYPSGQVWKTTDALGHVTEYQYDARGRLIRTIAPDPDGEGELTSPITQYAYDAAGQLTSMTDPRGNVTGYEYDDAGRLVKVTQPDPDGGGAGLAPWTVYSYDAAGNVLSVTDRLANSTTYSFDAQNRRTSENNANEETTSYTYDDVGNMLTLTDPEQNTTTWVYDDLNRVVEERNELDVPRYFVYNAAGLLVQKTDRNGHVTQYEYDNLYRETEENWVSGAYSFYTISYTYDSVGRMLSTEDTDGTEYAYEYDALGRVIEETQTFAGLTPVVVLTYEYNANGQRTQTATTIGGTPDAVTDYSYDHLGRVTSIQQHGALGGNSVAEKRIDLTYDDAGQYATVIRYADLAGAQVVAVGTYTYDDASRLTGLVYSQPNSTGLPCYGWSFDAAGNMTSMTTVDGTVSYTNDDTGQLTSAGSETYTYDDNGNRVTANGDSYVTGDNNRLLSDGTYTYQYDAEGNRTLRYVDEDESGTLSTGDSDITFYHWDYRNRLTEVDHTNSIVIGGNPPLALYTLDSVVVYTYDCFNRLVERKYDDGLFIYPETHDVFVYDGNQVAMHFFSDGPFSYPAWDELTAADLSHRYLWNPQAVDQLFADEQLSYDSENEELVTDELSEGGTCQRV